jgi:hypothetical protein
MTLAKMNQSHRNANWNSLLQSNKPSFNAVAAKMAKQSPENCEWSRTEERRTYKENCISCQVYNK